jgi:hypothetical protein
MEICQEELEKTSRWFSGVGCVFTEDFIRKHVGTGRMKSIDMMGAYIFRTDACIFISFGAGGSWIPNAPITKHITVNRTEAEIVRMASFMTELDPDNKFGVRTWNFHVDLAQVKIARRPTDQEIGRLQLQYRDEKKFSATPKKKRAAAMAVSKKAEPERLKKEIRAIDRRRFKEAGVVPPADRISADPSYLASIKGDPRKVHKIDKRKLDDYHSDTSDDEQRPWNWLPADEAAQKRRLEAASLLGEDDDEEEEEEEEEEEGGVTDPPAKKRPRRTSKHGKSGMMILEQVLRAMRARSQQRHPRL